MLFLVRRLALAFALFAGTMASQLPEYAQQYRQRLGGALDELGRVITNFDAQSTESGLDRNAAIARLKVNGDTLVQRQGEAMQDNVIRRDRLADQDAAFARAGPFARLGLLARDFDPGIARGAWTRFEPAVPVTSEGFISAGAGLLAGYGLWHLLALPFRRRPRGTTPRSV